MGHKVSSWNNEDTTRLQEEALDVPQVLQEDAMPPYGLHAEGELPSVQELLHPQEVIYLAPDDWLKDVCSRHHKPCKSSLCIFPYTNSKCPYYVLQHLMSHHM